MDSMKFTKAKWEKIAVIFVKTTQTLKLGRGNLFIDQMNPNLSSNGGHGCWQIRHRASSINSDMIGSEENRTAWWNWWSKSLGSRIVA